MDDRQGAAPSLLSGSRGLARTFWLFGVLVGGGLSMLFLVAAHLTDSIIIGLIGFIAVWSWQAIAGISIWRAAARYEGKAPWAALARVAVVASIMGLAYGTGLLVGLF